MAPAELGMEEVEDFQPQETKKQGRVEKCRVLLQRVSCFVRKMKPGSPKPPHLQTTPKPESKTATIEYPVWFIVHDLGRRCEFGDLGRYEHEPQHKGPSVRDNVL